MRKRLLIGLLICLLMSLWGCSSVDEREAAYEQAQTQFREGQYDQAEAAFAALGHYRDSRYMLSEIKMARTYDAALALLEGENYIEAYTALCDLGDYRDAKVLLERFRVVEVTQENWEEYFEITNELYQEPESRNSEGIYNTMCVQYVFRVKEEYRSKLYSPEETQALLRWSASGTTEMLDIDHETGAFTFVWSEEFYLQQEKRVSAKLDKGEQETVFHRENVGRQLNTDGTIDFYACTRLKDFFAVEAEGRLYLYEA